MNRKLLLTLPVFVTMLLLGACGEQGDQAGAPGADVPDPGKLAPHETVEQGVAALRDNNIKGFLKLTLPEAKYADMQAQWAKKKQEPIKPEEKAEYEETMKRLSEDGAEEKLMAEIRPQLEQMRPQMPMFVGMFQGIVQSAIAQSEDMSDTQREQAQSALTAMAGWAQRTDLASPDLAEEAVAAACETARELDLPTLEDVRALDFDEMLGKAGTLFAGLKEVLAVYDLNVNEAMDSVEAETLREDGDTATVRTTFEFLGTEQTVDSELIKVAGQWVSKEAMEAEIGPQAVEEG